MCRRNRSLACMHAAAAAIGGHGTAAAERANKRGIALFASVAPEYAADLSPGIDAINSQNSDLYDQLNTLRTRPFFRLYSVDILASCEYIPQELFECYSESCEIYPVDDDEVSRGDLYLMSNLCLA